MAEQLGLRRAPQDLALQEMQVVANQLNLCCEKCAAALAIRPGEAVSDDELCEWIWPQEPTGSKNRLFVTVSRARTTLEPFDGRISIDRTPDGYRLDVSPTDLDIQTFARAADGTGASSDDPSRLHATTAALALWRGKPFASLPDPAPALSQIHLAELSHLRLTMHACCDIARKNANHRAFGQAALIHGGIRSTYGVASSETMVLLDEAIGAVGMKESGLRARLLGRAGQEAYHVREFDRAEQLTTAGEALARRLGNNATIALTLEGRIWDQHHPHRLTERMATTVEMVERARYSKNREDELIARIWGACAWLESGRPRAP